MTSRPPARTTPGAPDRGALPLVGAARPCPGYLTGVVVHFAGDEQPELLRLLVARGFECEGYDLLFGVDAGGHNPRGRRAFEKAGVRVLRTVPEPDSVKATFTSDLVLTRVAYERCRAAGGGS